MMTGLNQTHMKNNLNYSKITIIKWIIIKLIDQLVVFVVDLQ